MIASVSTSVVYLSGSFFPAHMGTFPGFELAGLAFDPDSIEKAAVFPTVPNDWPSATVYLLGTSEGTGTAVFHVEIPTPEDPVEVVVSSSLEFKRVALAEDVSLNTLTGTDYLGSPMALYRDADSMEDDLDADFIVWGCEFVRGE